jgi:predicted nucleotidyltransferase component of viral defense system
METARKYSTANGLRMALEQRLNNLAKETATDIMRLRRQVAFDRFLARIFNEPVSGLVAKGGYTLDLRLKQARTTRDIDFSFSGDLNGAWNGKPESLKQFLQDKADIDLSDFFVFIIGDSSMDLENAPYGGYRFPIEARMGARRFVSFSTDIAAGDKWFEPHENIALHDWLGFAEIPAVSIPVISAEQQFAEKLHAYTQPRGRENSRVKDLIDMLLLVKEDRMSASKLMEISNATFKKRESSLFPPKFDAPPESWRRKFAEIANECGIDEDINAAVEAVRNYCAGARLIVS